MDKQTNRKPKEKVVKSKKESVNIGKFIAESIKEIRDKANLGDYNVSFRFANKGRRQGHGTVMAEINVDNTYMNAYVTIMPELVEMIRGGQYTEAKRILCHEIMHIRTEKLATLACNRFASKTAILEEIEKLTEGYSRSVFKNIYTNVEESTKPSKPSIAIQETHGSTGKVLATSV